MNCRFILSIAAFSLLAACGTGGNTGMTDGSGNPVRIGADPNASYGPSHPEWPRPSSGRASP